MSSGGFLSFHGLPGTRAGPHAPLPSCAERPAGRAARGQRGAPTRNPHPTSRAARLYPATEGEGNAKRSDLTVLRHTVNSRYRTMRVECGRTVRSARGAFAGLQLTCSVAVPWRGDRGRSELSAVQSVEVGRTADIRPDRSIACVSSDVQSLPRPVGVAGSARLSSATAQPTGGRHNCPVDAPDSNAHSKLPFHNQLARKSEMRG